MAMVTTGLSSKEVANFLGVVEKTVKVHRANIMNKLEVRSLAELVRCADRLGMTTYRRKHFEIACHSIPHLLRVVRRHAFDVIREAEVGKPLGGNFTRIVAP
ncbi:LuxR C-terminal-related transcriptional regulator [Cupriavidus sp. SW-Y-13]|uniref:LuxR C-terminal-related transcriptional regulator n=1 Tax=Cupriavidus sp. SW-Y-13 TaxID=2653854 RepID=UPI0013655185|nr:hypothetical protein [Cupriavidus sp. SW-Y-13]